MTPTPDLQRNIRELLLRDLKREARAFQPLKGGRNSQVFRVDCTDGSVFAAKAYFQSEQDGRDRLGCEFRALRFLKSEGVNEVPTPLAADETHRIAVYEFVAGQPMSPADIGPAETDQCVEFLRALKSVADSGKARQFPAASEACFSIEAILQNLDDRFGRLDKASANQPALADFLKRELAPALKLASRRCRDYCGQHGISPVAEIPMSDRTLSPSDFGFHNALRRADGRLVFLDFEYFGWDDPAKTVADFLLHPAMELTRTLRQRFFSGTMAAFAGVPGLARRVCAVHPLFALKWCAILLNEFTLEDRARRCFADGTQDAWDEAAQLEKARQMLTRATYDDHDFPTPN